MRFHADVCEADVELTEFTFKSLSRVDYLFSLQEPAGDDAARLEALWFPFFGDIYLSEVSCANSQFFTQYL